MTASEADRLVAVLPMIRKRSRFAGVPIWKLAGAANIHSSQFDILQSPGEAVEGAIPAVRNLFKRTTFSHTQVHSVRSRDCSGMKPTRSSNQDSNNIMKAYAFNKFT